MKQTLKQILPGFLLAFCVAILSKYLAHFIPNLGAATIAILLGILLGNTFCQQPGLNKGTKFSESRLLEWSIVLLGFTVTFQTIAKMGLNGFVFIIFQMTSTIITVYLIGRQLKFTKTMSLLMAGGNAVCGSSAIGAIAPEINAKEEEKGQIITLVNLLGTVLMLTLPFLATFLYPNEAMTQSAMIGGTLQSVGQVVASASMVSPEVVEWSTLFKIMRIMMLVLVVFFFGKFANDSKEKTGDQKIINKKKKLPLPWYIIGFLISCLLNSFLTLTPWIANSAHLLSGWFEVTALAAIGLRLNFKRFFKEGKRFLLYTASVGLLQIIFVILWIKIFSIQ